MKNAIIKIFEDSAQVKVRFVKENSEKIVEVVQLIAEAFREGKKVILFGNGGSATDASHIAAEFVNRFLMERPPLPAIALNTDVAVLTSISNDYDYSQVFSKQLAALGYEGDVAIGISTSGNSANVIKAVEVAKKNGLKTVILTGGTGGKLAKWPITRSSSPRSTRRASRRPTSRSAMRSARWWMKSCSATPTEHFPHEEDRYFQNKNVFAQRQREQGPDQGLC